jgi:DNA-binding XRE family transcriptional regulator
LSDALIVALARDQVVPKPIDEVAARQLLAELLRRRLPAEAEAAKYQSVQEALYRVRTTAGFDVAEMSYRLGVSPKTVMAVESGTRESTSRFSATVLERLAVLAEHYSLPRAAEFLRRLATRSRLRSYREGGRR